MTVRSSYPVQKSEESFFKNNKLAMRIGNNGSRYIKNPYFLSGSKTR